MNNLVGNEWIQIKMAVINGIIKLLIKTSKFFMDYYGEDLEQG